MEALSLHSVECDPRPIRGVFEQQGIGSTCDRDPVERMRCSEQLQKGLVERAQTCSTREQQGPIDVE